MPGLARSKNNFKAF